MQDWLEESESVGRRIVESDDHVASAERITKAASPDWAVTLHDGRRVTAERITKAASPDWDMTHVSANWNARSFESFNGRLRDECLNTEDFADLLEAQVVLEDWRTESRYAGDPPRGLGGLTPAAYADHWTHQHQSTHPSP